MMISPECYISEKKYWSLEKLKKEENELLEQIKRYEEGKIPEDEYFIHPSPNVIYNMNKEYLMSLQHLIDIKINSQEEVEEKYYYFLTVRYEDYSGNKEYNYISDDDTIEIEDRVLVDRAGNLTIAEVTDTNYYNEQNAPFPINKTKKVIKKVDENFDIDEINSDKNAIRMNIDGTNFIFGISNYTNEMLEDENWAEVRLEIHNRYFNYAKCEELLTCVEIKNLLDKMEMLLSDKIKEITELVFYEPDLEFYFYPKLNLWKTGKYTYIKKGHEIQDVYLELKVHLTNNEGVYVEQKYSIIFSREEIEKLVSYLKNII